LQLSQFIAVTLSNDAKHLAQTDHVFDFDPFAAETLVFPFLVFGQLTAFGCLEWDFCFGVHFGYAQVAQVTTNAHFGAHNRTSLPENANVRLGADRFQMAM
jgi:hypothetical protein